MTIRVRVANLPNQDGYLISILQYEDLKNVHIMKWDGTWDKYDNNSWKQTDPTDGHHLFLPNFGEIAQHLVDALYEAGVKPRAYVPSLGELDCKNAHIADLRRIVEAFITPRTMANPSGNIS